MLGAGILRRSRLLLYVGRMEGFGVQGMPCTCDLGRAEEPQQAAPSLRHSMPGARATVAWNLSGLPWNSLRAAGCSLCAIYMTHCIDDDSSMHINQQSISAFSALSVRENKVGSVKSEVGSEVGSMTERHFIQRRSVFPMRDNELKTPLRPLRHLARDKSA